MTFKKIISAVFMIFAFSVSAIQVNAVDKGSIPVGDILIVYSDGANEETMESVREIVKILTYQSFQVSFASATECTEELNKFSHIICYKLEKYPKAFLEKLNTFEKQGENSNEEESPKIMFVGNTCMKDYFDLTNRKSEYITNKNKVSSITYFFSDFESKKSLGEETFFLFLKDTSSYRSGEIMIGDTEGYFCATSGIITHIPVTDLNNELIKAAFTKEVAQWKWPYNGEPHIYAQYMVINMVYPFEDPEKLLDIVNLMILEEEPFVISVMPVYTNGNYPAMQRFCEVLRYAQANGGTIIMHSPINQMVNLDKDLMNEYITLALNIYISQGVYPMALQVPSDWMFNEDTIEIMAHFKTVFTTDEGDSYLEASTEMNTNTIYKDGHQWVSSAIKLDDAGTSHLRVSSTAVYINMQEDIEKIEEKILACQQSFVPLKSLWDVEHSFWTDEDILTYKNHMIILDGEVIKMDFEPTVYEENFKYNRNVLKRFSKDLTTENRKLVIAVSVISCLFLLFILIARYNNRKRFFIDKDDTDNNDIDNSIE